MPDQIQMHASAFGPWQTLAWNHVTVVGATCRRYVSRRRLRDIRPRIPRLSADLVVLFDGGERIVVPLGSGGVAGVATYYALRDALAHKTYRYATYNVSPDQCPAEVYPLLLNWRN
jgi:hypothetical protein